MDEHQPRTEEQEPQAEGPEGQTEASSVGDVEARAPEPGAPPTGNGQATDPEALEEEIVEALKNVHDPELGINIVDLGLVYGVDIEGDTVHVRYTLTTMACPIGPLIEAEMKQFISKVEGISNVDAEMVLRPPWTPDMMSEEAKAALGYF